MMKALQFLNIFPGAFNKLISQASKLSHKKNLLLSIESWLFNRDP